MASISLLNPKAEFARAQNAFAINLSAAKGLFEVLKSNLGPKGTMKMLVSGAGEIKLTKDGNVLLHEMQIQHPTASLIARVATAQDDMTGDGTTTNVLMIAELLKQADTHLQEGLHPRLITEGFDLAKDRCLQILDQCKVPIDVVNPDKTILNSLAKTALCTKLHKAIAHQMAEYIVDAVLTVRRPNEQIDLHMVEIMEMEHKTDMDSTLIKGLVLDHGGRHPDMPKKLENCHILVCNVSLEYEKTEINSSFFYKTAEERDKMVKSEREFIDKRVEKIIELKRSVCGGSGDKKASFVIINQKGIDPFSLDALAREGILALRRCKRRNMERLALACGGYAVNSFEGLSADCLGHAGLIYEYTLGEDKYTFVENCKNPESVTLLVRGPNKHTITQIKDAIRDGLRTVKNALEDECLVPGAAAFEVTARRSLYGYMDTVKGRSRLGIQAFADALMIVPKVLAKNAGHDPQDAMVRLLEEAAAVEARGGKAKDLVGLDLATGMCMLPAERGIYDNYCVKKQIINSCAVIATNLLLVDDLMRAGLSSLSSAGGPQG